MQMHHALAFADFTPAPQHPRTGAAPAHAPLTLIGGCMVETATGWTPAERLSPGDRVHTLDGGLQAIEAVHRRRLGTGETPLWRLPAASLNNCDTVLLPATQHVALMDRACERLFGAPCVLAPVTALAGFRGIGPEDRVTALSATELHFANEEIVYAQTGTLLHAPGAEGGDFFRRLDYGECRALLSLMSGGRCGVDRAATR